MWLSLRVSAFGLLICFKMSIVDQINPNILMRHSSSSCAPSARRCSLPHKFPNNLMSFPRRTQCARRRATRTGGFNRRPCQNAEKPPQCSVPTPPAPSFLSDSQTHFQTLSFQTEVSVRENSPRSRFVSTVGMASVSKSDP